MDAAFGERNWALVLDTHPPSTYLNDATKYLNIEGPDDGNTNTYWVSGVQTQLGDWINSGGKLFFNYNLAYPTTLLPPASSIQVTNDLMILVTNAFVPIGYIANFSHPVAIGLTDMAVTSSDVVIPLFNGALSIGGWGFYTWVQDIGLPYVIEIPYGKGVIIAGSLNQCSRSGLTTLGLFQSCVVRRNIHLYVQGVSSPPPLPSLSLPFLSFLLPSLLHPPAIFPSSLELLSNHPQEKQFMFATHPSSLLYYDPTNRRSMDLAFGVGNWGFASLDSPLPLAINVFDIIFQASYPYRRTSYVFIDTSNIAALSEILKGSANFRNWWFGNPTGGKLFLNCQDIGILDLNLEGLTVVSFVQLGSPESFSFVVPESHPVAMDGISEISITSEYTISTIFETRPLLRNLGTFEDSLLEFYPTAPSSQFSILGTLPTPVYEMARVSGELQLRVNVHKYWGVSFCYFLSEMGLLSLLFR
jgi:hypothetical protein